MEKLKLKLKLTQEQSKDIRDYILNRELTVSSHDEANGSNDGSKATDGGRVADDEVRHSYGLKKCDKQGAELDNAKQFEGDDKPEQKHKTALPHAKTAERPSAHLCNSGSLKNCNEPGDGEANVSNVGSEAADAEKVAEDKLPLSPSPKKCDKRGAEPNAAKKLEGDDEPELSMAKLKLKLKLKLTQEQSKDIRDYILNRELTAISHDEANGSHDGSNAADGERVADDEVRHSDCIKKCDKQVKIAAAKNSEKGERSERNQSLAPELSAKRISHGKYQSLVRRGITDDVDGISCDSRKVFIIYDKRMDCHRQLCMHDYENAKRIPTILAKLKERGLLERCGVSSKATSVEENLVSEVHSEGYIQFIKRLPLRGKELKPYYEYLSDDKDERKDFVSSSGTPLAVFLAAGAVVEACCQVATGNYCSSFAIVRPPGHHAKPSQANGFCFFNNIAIGARYLQRVHSAKRIMVVDVDIHHGDGTQEIFLPR